jgi:hypothetical protein
MRCNANCQFAFDPISLRLEGHNRANRQVALCVSGPRPCDAPSKP